MDKWTGKKIRRREVRIPEDWLELRTPQKVDPRLPSDWRGKSFCIFLLEACLQSVSCAVTNNWMFFTLDIYQIDIKGEVKLILPLSLGRQKRYTVWEPSDKFTKNERQRTDYVQNALLPYKKDFWKPFCCSWSVGKHCLWNYFHRGLVPNLCGLGFRFPS